MEGVDWIGVWCIMVYRGFNRCILNIYTHHIKLMIRIKFVGDCLFGVTWCPLRKGWVAWR
jgi:hypothetical protein